MLVKGTSIESVSNKTIECVQHLNVVIIHSSNQTVFGTGLLGREKYVVDSPDERELQVGWSYFGPNVNYNVKINNSKPSAIEPNVTVLKTMRYIVKW